MDNVIQNININDIIPIDNNINPTELNELVESIKKFGIIEPLILKPQNGKYEIVLGNKIYHAAKKAGINLLPAIIKDIDNKIIEEYRTISNIAKEEISSNNIPQKQNNINQKKDSDIVNLQELSKQEYEREDVKMNNEQNDMMNNNIGANQNVGNPSQPEPTFGGKFFPSLEDEPTNMNMEVQNVSQQSMSDPVNPVQPNFIDLTDSGAAPQMPGTEMNNPEPQPITEAVPTVENNQQPIPENIGNTINLENLTSGYNASPSEPQPVPEQQNNVPQFDMSQAVAPNPIMSPDIGLGINGDSVDSMNEPMNNGVPNFNEPAPEINNQDMNYIPPMNEPMNNGVPNFNEPAPEINNQDMNYVPPMNEPMNNGVPNFNEPAPEINNQDMNYVPPMNEQQNDIPEVKDVTPVINTIKTIAKSLEQFGYTINVEDEELSTSAKITIEIQK